MKRDQLEHVLRAKLHFGETTVICPDLHDLAVAKCVAGRDKDAH